MRHFQIIDKVTRPHSKLMAAYLRRKKGSEESIAYNRQRDEDGTLFIENPENGLRYLGKCHEVARKEDFRFDCQGWYLDEYCDETVCGGVYMLPHGRYVPATIDPWGNGACLDFSDIKDNARDAVYAADRLAELYAEKEREYRRVLKIEERVEEIASEIKQARQACRELCANIRANCDVVKGVEFLRKLIRDEVKTARRAIRELHRERETLQGEL